MMDLNLFYTERVAHFTDKEKECLKKERKYPFYRLLIFAAGIAVFIYLLPVSIFFSVTALLVFLTVFLVFLKVDKRNSVKKEEFQLLKLLNKNELKYFDGMYDFFDDGNRYKNDSHPYSNDLDIFGNSSLFHSLNRTTLSKSSDILSEWLLYPANKQEIEDRNQAVIELTENIEWRQQMFIVGYSLKKSENLVDKLINWIKKNDDFTFKKSFIILCYILSGITITTVALSFVLPIRYVPFLLIITNLILLWWHRKRIKQAHNEVTNSANILETYAGIIDKIEKEKFISPKLLALKQLLKSEHQSASAAIKRLSVLVSNFDVRYNVLLYPFLNIFLFWDIHQVYLLEKWKKNNKNLEQWFHSVGEFEALSSFANLNFNNPDWCFPNIIYNHFYFEAHNLGHPMIISKERVCNDLTIDGSAKILLISGSNMSGKSTFLRTVGVNLVLAMAGSCVCASEFRFSPVRILSSMRIHDSLKDKTSTFFAELKKLESIIKIVDQKEKVFILLDEILRGTNSIDKHIGSTALIKQLILNEAVGMLATHDLSLTDMSKEFPGNIENYNFNIKINNEDLYFDYLLNKGVCTTLNASILMKKMGIKIQ
jgi:hypothetical protein